MAEYIDREAFVADKRKQYCEDCDKRKGMKRGKLQIIYEIGSAPCRACGVDDMFGDIEDYPAADVAPARYGRWVISRTDYGWNCAEFPTHCKCDQCGREIPYQDQDNYCPNCGAKMEETE